jgi:hypothetical protein
MHAGHHLNSSFPRGGALLGFLLHWSIAAAGTVFQTDFEAAEGYVAGTSLLGQAGWHGLSPISAEAAGVAVDPQNQPALGQFGYIGGYRIPVLGTNATELTETKQIVTRNIAYTPGTDGGNVVMISMDLVPFYDSPDSFDQFGVAIVNSYQQPLCTVALSTLGSQLVVIDQLDEAGASAPGVSYVSGNRYELRFELDFGNNTWSAWFGGQVAATKRRLSTAGMAADIGSIAFTWGRYTIFPDSSANHYLIFDKLRVSAEPPPSLDASISLTSVPGSLDIDLSIATSPDSAIILQYSPTLDDSWEDLESFTVPANGVVTYRHAGVRSLPSGFYRVAGTANE